MTSNQYNRPNFIIIGAMKCATSTLHDQLANQPGVFMSTPKEPNFFSDDKIYTQGLDWYSNLFAGANAQLCGESSTHYTKFPTYPETINRMLAYGLHDIKLVYVMRDPIDRLVSHYIHEWSQGVINTDIDSALDKHPELINYSRYFYQLDHYLKHYPAENILPVFFHSLRDEPQQELERICTFLNYQGNPQWDFNMESRNVSAQRIRKFPLYDLLIESAPLAAARRILVPRKLRDSIKQKLTMQKRPKLSDQSRQRLVDIFDKDLRSLGEILGSDLSYQSFSAASGKTKP
ncbi:sulfotransferase family protein [Teredinibacter waterburyi]|jgi:Sulfotransferase domain.|uniref:sulfotransferase family protein n=1 Tax=Teredinibacter waterburyi TaxID=1500538 RepID=UPI00165FF4E6|nr:sulfotransferase [Teredinibacter waterburyi]